MAGGEPGVEDLVGAGAEVADVDAVVVEVEAERFGVAGAQREAGGAFGGVGEADEFVELDGAVGGLDVAEDAAGADRGELLVVADEAHRSAAVEDELDDLVQREGVGHAGLVDDDQARRPDVLGPRGERSPVVEGVGEEGHRVGVGVDLGAQLGGRGGRRCEADDGAAAVAPRGGEGAHGGGLAGAGGGDRELEAGSAGGHLADERDLAGVERGAVRDRLDEGDLDGRGGHLVAAAASGCVDEAVFGGDDPAGGVPGGAGDGVDAVAVGAAQRGGFGDAVGGGLQGDGVAGEGGVGEPGDDVVDAPAGHVGGPDDRVVLRRGRASPATWSASLPWSRRSARTGCAPSCG